MENAILEKVLLTIVGLATTGLIGWLSSQIVKYKKLIKKEEDETVKKTITTALEDGLKPIQDSVAELKTDVGNLKTDVSNMKNDVSNVKNDISNMKNDISKLQKFETSFSTRLEPTQEEIEHLKDDITEILDTIKQQGLDLQNISDKEQCLEKETRCAWRYRIRQLCHVYIARGYMSYEEYLQLQEMFNIYSAIGGNGQTKELYEKTLEVAQIKTDVEIAAIEAQNRGKSCPMVHE